MKGYGNGCSRNYIDGCRKSGVDKWIGLDMLGVRDEGEGDPG